MSPELQHAIALHQAGRLAEAAALYLQILAQNPDDTDALNLLGVVELQRKNLTAAVGFFDRALGIDPNNVASLSNRGVALHDLKRFDEALESYDRALALRPGNAEAHNNRATTLQELKRFAEALAGYERALDIQPTYVEALNNRGHVLRALKRFEDALSAYDRSLAIRPSAMAFHNRGLVLHGLKRRADAIASFEAAIALKPDYAEAYNNLGHVLSEQGRLDDAIACFERARTFKPDFAAHLNLGDAYLEQGRFDEALAAAEAAALLTGDPSFSHYSLGVLFARCNAMDAAREHLRIYLEQDRDDAKGARLILAGLDADALPQRASQSHMRELYSERAARWGGADRAYYAHELVGKAVMKLSASAEGLDILDAGCGTGLVGPLLRPIARRLDGVDLTPSMLEQAKHARVYDGLTEGDLVEFLIAHRACYDVVVSAATLIHFGDLAPVFAAAAVALRGQGLFVFTLFPNDGDDVAVAPLGGLGEGGCYVHSRTYVTRLGEGAGFSVVLMETAVHEHDMRGRAIDGLVVALKRPTAC